MLTVFWRYSSAVIRRRSMVVIMLSHFGPEKPEFIALNSQLLTNSGPSVLVGNFAVLAPRDIGSPPLPSAYFQRHS